MRLEPSNEFIELAIAMASGKPLSAAQTQDIEKLRARKADHATLCELVDLFKEASDDSDAAQAPSVDDETVAAYFDGSLTGARRTEVEAAIARNPRAIATLAALAELEYGPQPRPEPLWHYVIGLAKDGLRALQAPSQGYAVLDAAPALLQDNTTTQSFKTHAWSQEHGQYKLLFRVVQVNADREYCHLILVVTSPEAESPRGRAILYRDGQLLECITLSSSGSATFNTLAPGPYDIELDLLNESTVIFTLNLVDLPEQP